MMYEKFVEDMPKYESFKYWFRWIGEGLYEVFTKTDRTSFAVLDIAHLDVCIKDVNFEEELLSELEIIEEFESKFTHRPEYHVGELADVIESDLATMQFEYEVSLLGVSMMRAWSNRCDDPDNVISKFHSCIDWLRSVKFYEGPASTQYHESYPGGLLCHTLKVANQVRILMYGRTWNHLVSIESAVMCALVHDWCKINYYESFNRNIKNEQTNQWEKTLAYRRKKAFIPMGHGVSSYFLASKFFRLSPAESLAIRWHMGRWNVSDEEVNEFQQACETVPLVHLIQFADMLSITNYA